MIFWLMAGVCSLMLEGFFSGMETGMVSIMRPRAEHAARENPGPHSNCMMFFLNHPGIMISTTLIGVNLSIVCAALCVKNVFELCGFGGPVGITVGTAALSILCLIVEIIPKDWFRQAPYERCLRCIFLLYALYLLFKPVIRMFASLTSFLNRKLPKKQAPAADFTMREDLRLFIRESEGYGALDPETTAVLNKVITIPNIRLKKIFTPRKNIPSVPAGATIREAFDLASRLGVEKMPVCDDAGRSPNPDWCGIFNVYDAIAECREDLWDRQPVTSCMGHLHVLKENDGIARAIEISQHDRVALFVIANDRGEQTGVLAPEKIAELLFE